MYEVWLMLNIVWELLLIYRWPAAAALVALAVLWLAARGRSARGSARTFLVVAAVVFPLALVGLPMLTGSSITEARYAPDWLAVLGLAVAAAVLAGAFAAPLGRLLSGAPREHTTRVAPPMSGGAAPRA
jgi:hypothetical protein